MKKNYVALVILIVCLLAEFNGYSQSPLAIKPSATKHGPEKGSLILIGGGKIPPDIWHRFV